MQVFNKKTLATAMAAALIGLGTAGTAHAGAKAYSALRLDNVVLNKVALDGTVIGQVTVNNDITDLAVGNSAQTFANLDSVSGVDGDAEGPFGGNVNPDLACQGSGCSTGGLVEITRDDGGAIGPQNPGTPSGGAILENDFRQQAVSHFARGDANLFGAIVDNLTTPDGTAIRNFATADTVAEVQLTETDSGNSNSNVRTDSEFDFTTNFSGFISFEFDAFGLLEALLHQDEIAADASYSFNIVLQQITDANGNELVDAITIMDWSPEGDGTASTGFVLADGGDLNDGVSVLSEGSDSASVDTLGGARDFRLRSSIQVVSGARYNLDITHVSITNASAVKEIPEPATLGLLGVGLLGIGATRLRRRKA